MMTRKDFEEIAEAMNCPIGTVRSRIFRAREAIDRALVAEDEWDVPTFLRKQVN